MSTVVSQESKLTSGFLCYRIAMIARLNVDDRALGLCRRVVDYLNMSSPTYVDYDCIISEIRYELYGDADGCEEFMGEYDGPYSIRTMPKDTESITGRLQELESALPPIYQEFTPEETLGFLDQLVECERRIAEREARRVQEMDEAWGLMRMVM